MSTPSDTIEATEHSSAADLAEQAGELRNEEILNALPIEEILLGDKTDKE